MPLNKQKGNMYGFVTHTWNAIKGRCPHGCTYCYMHKIWDQLDDPIRKIRFPNSRDSTLRLDEEELKTDLGSGNFIFVGSSTDMWAKDVPTPWIVKTMLHIKKYPGNTYLFQTKSPEGFAFYDNKRENIVLGITLETNRPLGLVSMAPEPMERAIKFMDVPHYRKMVTIEPIMDFDLVELVGMIQDIAPSWVNIGADSQGNKLLEPSKAKIEDLISELKKFTEVKNKSNLKRLLK